MTSARRTILMFAAVWFVLALSQAARTSHLCVDGSTGNVLAWTLQFALLGAPLLVLRRHLTFHHDFELDVRGALALILLTYVPVTLALRLAEACVSR